MWSRSRSRSRLMSGIGVSSWFSSSPFPLESGPKEGALDHLCPPMPWKSKDPSPKFRLLVSIPPFSWLCDRGQAMTPASPETFLWTWLAPWPTHPPWCPGLSWGQRWAQRPLPGRVRPALTCLRLPRAAGARCCQKGLGQHPSLGTPSTLETQGQAPVAAAHVVSGWRPGSCVSQTGGSLCQLSSPPVCKLVVLTPSLPGLAYSTPEGRAAKTPARSGLRQGAPVPTSALGSTIHHSPHWDHVPANSAGGQACLSPVSTSQSPLGGRCPTVPRADGGVSGARPCRTRCPLLPLGPWTLRGEGEGQDPATCWSRSL